MGTREVKLDLDYPPAAWWIRQAITRAFADQARTIRISVRQIEAKALRKLRHPSRSKMLKAFLDM